MNFEVARTQMVNQQVRAWEVLDPAVLAVLASVPREQFVPPRYRNLAFADTAIPLPGGQLMLTPQVEGRLLQALTIRGTDRVLEIGTGSGFLTACLARLAASVTSLEILPELAEDARRNLRSVSTWNADVRRTAFDPARLDPNLNHGAAAGEGIGDRDGRIIEVHAHLDARPVGA